MLFIQSIKVFSLLWLYTYQKICNEVLIWLMITRRQLLCMITQSSWFCQILQYCPKSIYWLTPQKMNTEMHTGLYILPNFKFWSVFGRRGCLNKSPNLSILLKIKSDNYEVQYSFLCSLFSDLLIRKEFEYLIVSA